MNEETTLTVESPIRRRELLSLATGAALALPALAACRAHAAPAAAAAATPSPSPATGTPGAYTLPPLPYPKNALDGYLSAEILEIHHGKHHAAYVKGLNEAVTGLEEARAKGDFKHVKALERSLAFNGSGHVLHSLYWNSMSPNGGGEPQGELKKLIERDFGSVDAFRKHFAAATKAAEASSWGALAWEPLGQRLVVLAFEDHQNMSFQGATPLIVCDVWEHAYYLRYRNDRGTYVDRFFDVANWNFAQQRLNEAMKKKA